MRVFRIARARYGARDGEGARLVGGRWNSPGIPVIYTGTSRSITMLEVLLHADPDLLPEDLVVFEIEIPAILLSERIETGSLPDGWRAPGNPECIALGDQWLLQRVSPILLVPSAIVPEEWNLLINPRHGDAGEIAIIASGTFSFDPRLLRAARD